MKDIIIIPDVHGREFWKDAVLNNLDKKIIFTGDYLDPYPDEGILPETAFEMLQEIVKLKEEHPNNIVLLLGNHDCSYMYGTLVCDCRRDKKRYVEIQRFMREKHKLFDIVHEENVNGKQFIFSHAGILKGWVEYIGIDKKMNIVNYLNNKNQVALDTDFPEEQEFCDCLSIYDYWRGYGGYDYGSIVWCDLRSLLQDKNELYPDGSFHVFGHTQLVVDGIFKDNFACLDCHKAFVLHEDGTITLYKNEDNGETEHNA